MADCTFTVTPGAVNTLPMAQFGRPVTLTNPVTTGPAPVPLVGGFGAEQGDLFLVCRTSGVTHSLSPPVSWTSAAIVVNLPAVDPCPGPPYDIKVLRPAGVLGAAKECLAQIEISKIPIDVGDPAAAANLRNILGSYMREIRINSAGSIEAGETLTPTLVGLPPPITLPIAFVTNKAGRLDSGDKAPMNEASDLTYQAETSSTQKPTSSALVLQLPPNEVIKLDLALVDVQVAVEWQVLAADRRPLAVGKEFVAPKGRHALEPEFKFAPPVALGNSPIPISTGYLRASVTLTARPPDLVSSPVSVGPFMVPEVPVLLFGVNLPAIAAFFRDPNLTEDPAMILISAGATLGAGDNVDVSAIVNGFLHEVESVLIDLNDRLGTLMWFASYLTGLGILKGQLNRIKKVFIRLQEVRRLSQVVFAHGSWLPWEDDKHFDDRFHSFIFLGVPGQKLECNNNVDFKPTQGQLNAMIPFKIDTAFYVEVDNLSNPVWGDQVELGRESTSSAGVNNFGDTLSSLKFSSFVNLGEVLPF